MISVVIPTYNRARYLKPALESLQHQSIGVDNFEVIIIDDGSTDGTKKITEKFNNDLDIKYFHQKHLGVSKARNMGIDKSSGEVIAFFDDDALADNRWLENIIEIMKNENIITGRVEPIKDNIWQYFAPHYNQGSLPIESSILLEGNCAIKKSVFKYIGKFDEKLTYGHEGNEFILRASGKYKVMYYPDVVIKHDYASSIFNYFAKQFSFGHKMAYLNYSRFTKLYDFIKSYHGIKVGDQKPKNKVVTKEPYLFDKIIIAIVSRMGNIFHFIGSVSGYLKYKN